MSRLRLLPCLDSELMAAHRRQELDVPADFAGHLGHSAVEAARAGFYFTKTGQKVDWSDAVSAAWAAKLSIDPGTALPSNRRNLFC